jgi:hypothetical protein
MTYVCTKLHIFSCSSSLVTAAKWRAKYNFHPPVLHCMKHDSVYIVVHFLEMYYHTTFWDPTLCSTNDVSTS